MLKFAGISNWEKYDLASSEHVDMSLTHSCMIGRLSRAASTLFFMLSRTRFIWDAVGIILVFDSHADAKKAASVDTTTFATEARLGAFTAAIDVTLALKEETAAAAETFDA
jgi:hypothetical protein